MTAHELELRVYYEDTDAAGIVYHSNYLKFAERGRTELLRGLGFDHRQLRETHGVLFTVARCTIDFLRPARLDDLLRVRTEVDGLSGARLALVQTVLTGDLVLARLLVALAVVDAATLRPTRLPEAVRQAFFQATSNRTSGQNI